MTDGMLDDCMDTIFTTVYDGMLDMGFGQACILG